MNRLRNGFRRFGLGLATLVLLSTVMIACGDNTATTAPAATLTTVPQVTTSAPVTTAAQQTTSSTTSPSLATRPGYSVGETKRLGGGLVQTWVKVDAANKPTALGLTLSESVFQDLSPSSASQLPMNLPAQATTTAFTHISVDWNPQGHEPAGIYDKPHFDLHFYVITPEERNSILPSGDVTALTKSPPAEAIPAGYNLPPGPVRVVPGQGVHWFDLSSPEFRGQLFTQTMIYGFANAKIDFIEPMITKAYLESKPDFSNELKLPTSYPKSGVAYPTRYSIKYDAANKEYLIALEGLTMR